MPPEPITETALPHSDPLPLLQSLNLNNNRLEVLPEPIGDLPALVRLDVSNNAIRFLPASMGLFRKAQRIDCSNNLLSRYERVWGGGGEGVAEPFILLMGSSCCLLNPNLSFSLEP